MIEKFLFTIIFVEMSISKTAIHFIYWFTGFCRFWLFLQKKVGLFFNFEMIFPFAFRFLRITEKDGSSPFLMHAL